MNFVTFSNELLNGNSVNEKLLTEFKFEKTLFRVSKLFTFCIPYSLNGK